MSLKVNKLMINYKHGDKQDIINKFLLVGDNFMAELHLWDPRFKKYSAWGPFTKHQQRVSKFLNTGLL